VIFKTIFISIFVWSAPWPEHQKQIQFIEKKLHKFERELDILVQRKKNSFDQVRLQETLERIITIHSELIHLRQKMDDQKEHLQAEHPDKAHVLKHYDASLMKPGEVGEDYFKSELSPRLNDLLLKVKLKYSSFLNPDKEAKKELAEVDKMIKEKKKVKRSRDAEAYLRERSDIKLSK